MKILEWIFGNKAVRELLITSVSDVISGNTSLSEFLQTAGYTLGGIAIILLVFMGIIIFLPSIIAVAKKAGNKGIIIILNIFLLLFFYFGLLLPKIGWAILMIFALTGKRKIDKFEIPNITIEKK